MNQARETLNETLLNQATDYAIALRNRDPIRMLDFIHPIVIKISGGEKGFKKTMKEVFDEAAKFPDKAAMFDITVGKIIDIKSHRKLIVSRFEIKVPFVIDGKKIGDLVGTTLGFSRDEGQNWKFIENKDIDSFILPSDEAALVSRLQNVKPAFVPIFGKKRCYKDDITLKQHLFILALAVMKPEAVAESHKELRDFARELFRKADYYKK